MLLRVQKTGSGRAAELDGDPGVGRPRLRPVVRALGDIDEPALLGVAGLPEVVVTAEHVVELAEVVVVTWRVDVAGLVVENPAVEVVEAARVALHDDARLHRLALAASWLPPCTGNSSIWTIFMVILLVDGCARRTGLRRKRARGKGWPGSVQAREFDDEDLGGAFGGDFCFLAARTVEVGQLRVGAILDAKPGIRGPRDLRSVQSEVVRGAGGEADHREPDVGVGSRVFSKKQPRFLISRPGAAW